MVHPYNENSTVYNFFFHPLHQPKVKKLAIITFVALSILTGFLWQIPFWIVNRLDHCKVTEWKADEHELSDVPIPGSDAVDDHPIDKPVPVTKKKINADLLHFDASKTTPLFSNANKKYVYDTIMDGVEMDDQLTVTYHALASDTIQAKKVFGERGLGVQQHAGTFPFPPSNEAQEHWTANFADNHLLGFCKGGLLAQEELLCVEHPSLVHLKDEIAKNPEHSRLKQESAHDRIALIRGAKRRARLNMYGNGFAGANQDEIKSKLQLLDDPQESNIFAFAAPRGTPNSRYTKKDMERVFHRAFNAFSAIKQGADERGKTPVVHSGNWGCGAFGGNPQITGLLQMLAASAAGIEDFNFYPMSSYGQFQEALGLFENLKTEMPDATTSEVLAHLADNYDFRWGVSNGT